MSMPIYIANSLHTSNLQLSIAIAALLTL